MVTAAVVEERGGPFRLTRVEFDDLRPDEVRVRVRAAGVCHTDLAARDGRTPFPLPAVLGHEGAGVVEEIGSAVTSVAPGDRVVLSFPSCGHCTACRTGRPVQCDHWVHLNLLGGSRLDGSSPVRRPDGRPLHAHFFGQSSFATHATAPERGVVRVESSAPWQALAPLGCGTQTGAGTVLNVLRPEPGTSLVVYGAGGVGLAAVLAARLTPVTQVIVVDRIAERLALATSLGATATVNAVGQDVSEAVAELTSGRGADYVLESTGVPAVLRQAVDLVAVNGRVAVVGAPPFGSEVSLDVPSMLTRNPTVIGVNQGFSVPQRMIPALAALQDAGRFPLERLVTAFAFEEINDAATAAENGGAVKPVLLMD
ncbi:NAD(P)-dependent alcohol dehydrogenase [Nocardiopsis sp. NPDC050513]|uniref:NAD(P)-dependent alcohol dehydrogenase n=1 Tax=Nocardiopsis sp. NPDC050513 TaxID=3364338 RepID=UPI00379E9136